MRPWDRKFLDWVERWGDRAGISLLVLLLLIPGCALAGRLMRLGGFSLVEIHYEIHPNANANDNASGDPGVWLRDEQGDAWSLGGVLDRVPPGGETDGGAEETTPGGD